MLPFAACLPPPEGYTFLPLSNVTGNGSSVQCDEVGSLSTETLAGLCYIDERCQGFSLFHTGDGQPLRYCLSSERQLTPLNSSTYTHLECEGSFLKASGG